MTEAEIRKMGSNTDEEFTDEEFMDEEFTYENPPTQQEKQPDAATQPQTNFSLPNQARNTGSASYSSPATDIADKFRRGVEVQGGGGGASGAARAATQSLSNYAGLGNKMTGLGDQYAGMFNRDYSRAVSGMERYANIPEQAYVDRAHTEVNSAFDQSQGRQLRDMSRMGINPNSARYQGMNQDLNIKRAAALAGARNEARLRAQDISFNRQSALAGQARGLGQMSQNAYSQGANIAGNVARTTGNVAYSAGSARASTLSLINALDN